MKITYQCKHCGEEFYNDEKVAQAHEDNCAARNYKKGDRVEVLYENFDADGNKWLKGTIINIYRSAEYGLSFAVHMDEPWHEADTDIMYNDYGMLVSDYNMLIPKYGVPSISKNVRYLAQL